jgi:hypothetical protein
MEAIKHRSTDIVNLIKLVIYLNICVLLITTENARWHCI